MRSVYPCYLTVICINLSAFSHARVALYGRTPGQTSENEHLEHKRQPSTPQEQPSISVPVPGQQSQNTDSTSTGNGASNEPGMVTNNPATNNKVNCRDLTTGRDNKCWDELGLTKWVEDWVDMNVCYTDESFASCFLRKEGFPGLDCTGIKVSACTSPQGDSLMREPEVFYVAYNIYGKL